MQQGIVKWFNPEKGYGFISSKGKECFVHYSDIQSNGFKTLTEGQSVTFELETTPKGGAARKVVILSD